MMVAAFRSGPQPEIGAPRVLFEGDYLQEALFGRYYDISPDGRRFLMITSTSMLPASTQVGVVLNWFEELEEKVGN